MMLNSNSLRALAAELALARGALEDKTRALIARHKAAATSTSEAEIIALAYEIHNFYGLCEQIFERIRGYFAVPIARPDRYHEELLNQMALEIPQVRPAVISPELRQELDEFRRFHHFFRHAYVASFDRHRVLGLAERVTSVAHAVSAALETFQSRVLEIADRIEAAE